MTQSILSIQHLVKRYGEATVVSDMSNRPQSLMEQAQAAISSGVIYVEKA